MKEEAFKRILEDFPFMWQVSSYWDPSTDKILVSDESSAFLDWCSGIHSYSDKNKQKQEAWIKITRKDGFEAVRKLSFFRSYSLAQIILDHTGEDETIDNVVIFYPSFYGDDILDSEKNPRTFEIKRPPKGGDFKTELLKVAEY